MLTQDKSAIITGKVGFIAERRYHVRFIILRAMIRILTRFISYYSLCFPGACGDRDLKLGAIAY